MTAGIHRGSYAPPEHDKALEAALEWARAGRGAALATVVETWGSAPRQAGAQLAISDAQELVGSVSGGCVEAAVAAEAVEAMADGRPRLLSYGVSDDDAFAVGLACGGRISVLVDPVGVGRGAPLADLDRLADARRTRTAIAYRQSLDGETRSFDTEHLPPTSGLENETSFLTLHAPPPRLAIVGAAHIAQALAPMAAIAGYDVLVVDPRAAFSTPERFPETALSTDWPDAALAEWGLDGETAVACFTHDPKIDDPALLAALGSPAFYVGALGSTRTHAKRVDRLRTAGLDDAALARIDAPIGLDIGAKTPAEVALATLAAVTEARRRRAR